MQAQKYRGPPTKIIGLLVGLAAATPAIGSPIPVKPWHAFILSAFALSFFFRFRLNRDSLLRVSRLDVALFFFTLTSLIIELINAKDLNYNPNYVSVSRPIFWALIFWAVRNVVYSHQDARDFLTWFCAPVFPSVAIGFGQILGIDAIQQMITRLTPGSGDGFIARIDDGRLLRATAFVQHWTSFGSYLCTVVAAGSALLVLAKVCRSGRNFYAWCVLSVAGLGTLSTFTLSSIITAFAIFIACGALAKVLGRIVIITFVVGLIGVFAAGTMIEQRLDQQFNQASTASSNGTGSILPSTLNYRYGIWTTQTIPMIRERPITGWGTNVYDYAVGAGDARRLYPHQMIWNSPESQWLALMMTYGISGFLAFGLALIFVTHLLFRSLVKKIYWISVPISTLFTLMLIAAFTAPVFTNHGLPLGFWALLGVLAAFTYSRRSVNVSS